MKILVALLANTDPNEVGCLHNNPFTSHSPKEMHPLAEKSYLCNKYANPCRCCLGLYSSIITTERLPWMPLCNHPPRAT